MAVEEIKGVVLRGVSKEQKRRTKELVKYLRTEEGKKMMEEFWEGMREKYASEFNKRHCRDPFCAFCREEPLPYTFII